jgi:hypothetical protein
MLQLDGYMTMDANEIGITVPTFLMDCGHHRQDMPMANCRERLEDAESKLPCEHLHVKVILSQKTQPYTNAIKHR